MLSLTDSEKEALRTRCSRWLSYSKPRSPSDWVASLGASPNLHFGIDTYSNGPAIQHLERTVADMLGKEAGLWFPKGIVAQQAALLVHAAERRSKLVALHPKSHLALDEADALERLAGLTAVRIGKDSGHFGVEDLAKIGEPLAAVTLELPLRRAGYQALAWDRVLAISTWARENHVPLHLDGARLWEVQPWYRRTLAEIATVADSVYVSLYKGLGGIAGCILAGPESLIAALKVWRLRFGGDLPTSFPLIISALDGIDQVLPKMADYHRKAIELAEAIGRVDGVSVFPSPPHCNSFQVHFDASATAMEQAALTLAQDTGTWVFGRFAQGLLPETSFGEVVVGEASLGWTAAEAEEVVKELCERTVSFSALP